MKLSFVMIYNDGTLKRNEDLSTETTISLVYQFF
jgi:putative salt-induced outer membrane protein